MIELSIVIQMLKNYWTQSYDDLVRKARLSRQSRHDGEFYSTVYDCKDATGHKLTSGIYIVKVTAGGKQVSTKITILR